MIIQCDRLVSDLIIIVLRLDGFHAEVSYLGCIGHSMASSGLQELLQLIYAPGAVAHMLSGKAIARAVRTHFIVDAARNALMLTSVLNAPLPSQHDISNSNDNAHLDLVDIATMPPDDQSADVCEKTDLEKARALYEKLMDGIMSVEETCVSDVLNRIKHRLQTHVESANMSSRTSAL